MRWTGRILDHTVEALSLVLDFRHPADGVLSRYFREHHTLGHAERGAVADTVYLVLRRLRTLEAACHGYVRPRSLVLAALVRLRGLNLRELEPLLNSDEKEFVAAAKATQLAELSAAIRNDLPDWLQERLEGQYGVEATAELAAGLNRPAPLDLRVNPMLIERDAAIERLVADGMAASPCPYSPLGIRLDSKPALSRHALFVDGAIEVQDEGSQLLGYLVQPKRGEMVVDFCAGAGGKTLLLGAMMRSQGRLYAFDVAGKRLEKLKPRLARSGLSNVHPIRIDDERDQRVRRLAGKIDRVLVDAPCSGIGTLRRNPDLKWRQSPEAVAEMAVRQGAILASAAMLLKKGGRLVYATCSPLAAENDGVVDAFLAAHPEYVELDAEAVLAAQGISLETGKRLRLLPHRHGTDGFFAALIERR
jgi:16S rRNA (cytosine967-C5)-methyltransferase